MGLKPQDFEVEGDKGLDVVLCALLLMQLSTLTHSATLTLCIKPRELSDTMGSRVS